MLPFMEYIEARQRYTKLKVKQRELFQRVQVLKKRNAPALEFKGCVFHPLSCCRPFSSNVAALVPVYPVTTKSS